MSARDDYPELGWLERGAGVTIIEDAEEQATRALDEIDRLRAELGERREATEFIRIHDDIVRVRGACTEVYKPKGVDIWMGFPNPALGWRSPVAAITDGDTAQVLQVIERLTTGSFG